MNYNKRPAYGSVRGGGAGERQGMRGDVRAIDIQDVSLLIFVTDYEITL